MNAEQMFEELGYRRSTDIDAIAYSEKLDGTFYHFDITFDLLEKEITIGTNMENVIENDLLQAIIQQVKELHWLDEKAEIKQEIKQETNYDHFKDEIIERVKSVLSVVKGEPKPCNSVYCEDCEFFGFNECTKEVKGWLNKPYKKPTYKLSKFEFDLLNTYERCKECCTLNEIESLKKMSEKGYFKDIDPFTKVHDIIDNCEVIK